VAREHVAIRSKGQVGARCKKEHGAIRSKGQVGERGN
jgi:hypothetical protein